MKTFVSVLIAVGSLSLCASAVKATPGSQSPPIWLHPIVQFTDSGGTGMSLTFAFEVNGTMTGSGSANYSITMPGNGPAFSGTMNFPQQIPQAIITIPLNYSQIASNPQVTVNVSNAVNVSAQPQYTVSIPQFTRRTLTVSSVSQTEGNSGTSVLPFTVSMDKAIGEALTFTYISSGGTATAGGDYVPVFGTATIPPGGVSTTINVSVKGDTEVEGDETMGLDISEISLPVIRGTDTLGTILNDDALTGAVPGDTMVTEASGTGTATAWFSVDLPVARIVPYTCKVSTRDGTALAGSDYKALASTNITFAAGETHKWVAISVTASAAVENTENFFLDVEDPGSHEVKSAACLIERLAIVSISQSSPGVYSVSFPAGLGQRYFIEESSSPDGTWTAASSLLSGAATWIFQDVYSTQPRGFFRVHAFSPVPPGSAATGS